MDAQATEAEDVQKIKVVFLGDRSVGKTSIIKRFTRDEFTEKQNPTIGIEYMFKTLSYRAKKYRMELWDTAGQEKYRSLVRNYLRDADCALFIYDVNQPQTYNHLVDWVNTFEQSQQGEPVTLLVGNKTDLRQQDFSRDGIDLNFITNRQLKQLEKFEHLEVSAKDGSNIGALFQRILAQTQKKKSIRVIATRLQNEPAKGMSKHCCLL